MGQPREARQGAQGQRPHPQGQGQRQAQGQGQGDQGVQGVQVQAQDVVVVDAQEELARVLGVAQARAHCRGGQRQCERRSGKQR